MKEVKKQHTNKFLDGKSQRNKSNTLTHSPMPYSNHVQYNFLIPRLKAFITDMFLINMPLLYFVVYVLMGGKEAFQHNHIIITLCEFTYCFILFLFFRLKGQTPGFRYAEIMLCSDNSKQTHNIQYKQTQNSSHNQYISNMPPTSLQIVVYLFVWVIELSFFLWVFSFMRKDKKTLHELLSKTTIIYKPNPTRQLNEKSNF